MRVTISCRYFIALEVMLLFLVTSRMPRSGKLPVLDLLTGQKSGFSQGRLVAPIQVKLCRTDEHMGQLGRAKFHINRRRGVGMRLDYFYEFDACCQRYVATCGKNLYRCTSTVPALNYCVRIFFQIPQLSIRSGAHKLFHQFLHFSQFLSAISRKLWRLLATNVRTM